MNKLYQCTKNHEYEEVKRIITEIEDKNNYNIEIIENYDIMSGINFEMKDNNKEKITIYGYNDKMLLKMIKDEELNIRMIAIIEKYINENKIEGYPWLSCYQHYIKNDMQDCAIYLINNKLVGLYGNLNLYNGYTVLSYALKNKRDKVINKIVNEYYNDLIKMNESMTDIIINILKTTI